MKKIAVIILALLLAGTATACSSKSDKLSDIRAAGELVVYTDPNFPPFEFLGGDGVQGVDIEIARAIGAELGVSVTFKEANFDSILMALTGGKGDIAVSGFTILEERKQSVDFSDPYIDSVQYLIVPADSPIAVLEDLADKKVGVAKGYTGQFLMEDELEGALAGTSTSISEYNSAMEAALDMKAGRIEAVVMDEYVAKNVVAKQEGLEAKELRYRNGDLASESYGVAVPKGNEELVELINGVIKRLQDEGKIRDWVVQFSE